MTEKTKLLLVADTFYPKVDGIIKFMEEFVKRSQEFFEIHYLVPDFGKKHHNAILIENSRFLSLSGYPNMKMSLRNLSKIKKAVKNTEIVFVQGPALISYLSIYYGKRFKKKIIYYHHIFSWDLFAKFAPPLINKLLHQFVKKLTIFLYNRCQEILVPYNDLVDQLKAQGVKTKITVAQLGVDINLFSQTSNKEEAKRKLGLDPHKKVIGYVGRFSKEKNIKVLIDAFNKLHSKEHLQLLLVGGSLQNNVENTYKNIESCVVTGFVNNVHQYLKAMDIFVMPSLTETTSLATLEAMATGLPIISTKVGFIKKYLIKDYNGLFFPKNNSTMLSIKLEKLLNNPDLREKLGNNARKTVAYSFSWERSINKVKKILLQL
ncbi:MAG: glycosyltransferase family 4 protein [Candidatus Woesearchaeota archaeon]